MNQLKGLDPTVAYYGQLLLNVGARAGYQPRVTSGLRSFTQQLKLYLKSQLGLSKYPALPPGESMHQLGRAFDIVTVNDSFCLPQLGALWKSWGGRWSATDPIHFEA